MAEIGQPKLKIRWAPKIRQEKIWRLYQSDASGTLDDVLVDDVGLALLARCESVIAHADGKGPCPQCRRVTAFKKQSSQGQKVLRCAECDWETTPEEYRNAANHEEIGDGRAFPFFAQYVECYPAARSTRERMVLIDQLIHSFHHSLRGSPWRSVANNLIEGSHWDVVTFLDRLTYGDASTPEVRDHYAEWRESVTRMWQTRRGGGKLVDIKPRLAQSEVRSLVALSVESPTPEEIERVCSEYGSNGRMILLGVTHRSDVIGCIGIQLLGCGEARILHIAVLPDHRRRGIGRKMIEVSRAVFSLHKITAESDADAVGFFRACGFAIESPSERPAGPEKYLCTRAG